MHTARAAFNSRPPIVLQGIQRSGTNYACELLEQSGYFVLNRVDPRRDDPRHKHFRWQADKSTITMDPAFQNRVAASRLAEVNAAAGWRSDQRHVLVFKDPHDWLMSIERWAVASSWISNDLTGVQLESARRRWLSEWNAYHATWFGIAAQEPDKVLIIAYADLVDAPQAQMDRVHQMTGATSATPLLDGGRVKRVRHSHGPRVSRRLPTEAQHVVSDVVTCNWREHLHTE